MSIEYFRHAAPPSVWSEPQDAHERIHDPETRIRHVAGLVLEVLAVFPDGLGSADIRTLIPWPSIDVLRAMTVLEEDGEIRRGSREEWPVVWRLGTHNRKEANEP